MTAMKMNTPTKTVDNGVNVAALLGAREALEKAPEAAQFKWRASCEWLNGTHSRSCIGSFFGLGAEQSRGKTFTRRGRSPGGLRVRGQCADAGRDRALRAWRAASRPVSPPSPSAAASSCTRSRPRSRPTWTSSASSASTTTCATASAASASTSTSAPMRARTTSRRWSPSRRSARPSSTSSPTRRTSSSTVTRV